MRQVNPEITIKSLQEQNKALLQELAAVVYSLPNKAVVITPRDLNSVVGLKVTRLADPSSGGLSIKVEQAKDKI